MKSKPESKPVLKCDLCEYSTIHPQVLGSHKLRVHKVAGEKTIRKGDVRFPCDKCSFNAKTVGGLKHHQNAQHKKGKKNAKPETEIDAIKEGSESFIKAVSKRQAIADARKHALIGVAAGRVVELCKSLATKYGVPESEFAEGVLSILSHAEIW